MTKGRPSPASATEENAMAIDPMDVWASMKTKTWPGRYWMADLDARHLSLVGEFLAADSQSYCCLQPLADRRIQATGDRRDYACGGERGMA